MTTKYLPVSIIPFCLLCVTADVLADEVVKEKEQVIIIKEPPPAPAVQQPVSPAKVAPAKPAAPGPWYAGAGVGRTWLKGGAVGIDPDIATEGAVISLDDRDSGWKAFVGYQFHPNFAAELSYVDLGDYNVQHVSGPGTEIDKVSPDSWCLSGVGSYPLRAGFSIIGKLGICKWNDHASETVTGGGSLDNEASDDGTDLTFAVGASYDLSPRITTRLELERYLNVSHDKGDVDMLSINLLYRF